MLAIIQSLFFAVTETFFAWHMLTCTERHSMTIAFAFTILTGAFWMLVVFEIDRFISKEKKL